MSTVGYGDLTPQNQPEVIFVGFTSMLCSCVFAYCINSIGNMLTDISQREQCFKQRKQDVLQYLNSRNISRNLQTKIIRYLDYLKNIENSQSHINGNDIMKYFSDNLRFEINKEFFGKQLRESKVFGLNFTHSFLNCLAQTMKEITLAPGDILYQKNEIDNRIMFLHSGDIELYEKEVRLRIIEKGEVLNYRGFFGNFTHSSSARSLSISHLSYCTKEDMIEVLKTFPQDYESYCFIRDEMMLYNRTIDSKCCSCQSYSHTFQECPLIHYKINKDVVLRRWNFQYPNERREVQRRKTKFKSFMNLQSVKNKLKQYKVNLISKMEDYSYLQGNDVIEYLGDKEFYKHLPSIKISEDGKVYQQSEYTNTEHSEYSDDELNTERDNYFNQKGNSVVNQNSNCSPKPKLNPNNNNSSKSSNNLHQSSGGKRMEDDILSDNDKAFHNQPSIEFQVNPSSMTFNKQISNVENNSNYNNNPNNSKVNNNNQINNIFNLSVNQHNQYSENSNRNKSQENIKFKEDNLQLNGKSMSIDFNQSQQLHGSDLIQQQQLKDVKMYENIYLKQDSLQPVNQSPSMQNYWIVQKQNSSNLSNNQGNNNSGHQKQNQQQPYNLNALFVQQNAAQQQQQQQSKHTSKKNFKLQFKQYNSSDSSEFQRQQSRKSRATNPSLNQGGNKQNILQTCTCNLGPLPQLSNQNNSLNAGSNSQRPPKQSGSAALKLKQLINDQINQMNQQQEFIQINSAYQIPNQDNLNMEERIKCDTVFQFDFDQMKEFTNYYPHNNFSLVIKSLLLHMRNYSKAIRQSRKTIKKGTFIKRKNKKNNGNNNNNDTPKQKVIKLQKSEYFQ